MATTIAFDLIANDRASGKFSSFGKAVDSSAEKMKRWAKVGAVAVAAAAVAIGKGLFEATQAALADQKAQATLATQLKNSAKATDSQVASVERWIEAQGRALGVTDDELRPSLARLVSVTKDVSKAQELASLAMDVSAGTGKSLQTVTEALMKAENGSVGGLARLGVATKDAAGETLALDVITKNLAKTYEGQASVAAETAQGKMDRLKVAFDETKEEIGAKLIPVVVKLGDFMLNKVVPAATAGWAVLEQKLGPALAKVGEWAQSKLIPALRELAGDVMSGARKAFSVLSGSGDEFRNVMKYLGDIVTKVVIPTIGWLAKNVLPVLAAQLRISLAILSKIADAARWVGDKLKAAFDKAAVALSPLISRLQTAFSWMQKLQGNTVIQGGSAQGPIPDRFHNGGNTGTGAGTPEPPNSHTRTVRERPASRTSDEDTLYRAVKRALQEQPIVRVDSGRELYSMGGFS